MTPIPTGSQTVGPFFAIGFAPMYRAEIAPAGVAGERVAVTGRVVDGDGKPVPDAVVEVWQADAEGRYPHPEDPRAADVDPRFRGFGRVPTDGDGVFRFTTVKPGRVPGPGDRPQAPHLVISIFMRGLLKRLATRMYFPGDPANAMDPVLELVDPARRATLIAARGDDGATLRWDVALQGERETVFLDC